MYNNRHIEADLHGRTRPVLLNDGDVLIFGGGEKPVINGWKIWAMYVIGNLNGQWRVADTKGMRDIAFSAGTHTTCYTSPDMGLVVCRDDAMAIYMGDVTYLSRNIRVEESMGVL